MVDLDILQKKGVTAEKLKAAFTKDPLEEGSKVKPLIDLIHSRTSEGVSRCVREARHWAALDAAFDASFYAITPTLARSLLSGKLSSEDVLKAAQEWGLTHLIRDEIKDGKRCKTIDLPAFFQVTVPIAKAYVIIRTAKIFNDRNLVPLFKYDPARLTQTNKMRCDIITDRIQTMASQMDYPGIMRQAILTKNIYGICLQFPAECWYTEKQLHEKDGKEVEKIVREGLRYNLPHPSRCAYDLNYRVGTFNSDTGCSWGLYWQVQRYGDVKDNENYFNTDKISYGTNWATFAPTFFSTVYPCVMKFPDGCSSGTSTVSGAGATDRESQAGFYASAQTDQAVTLTQMFMKIRPKKYGLGDYDHPVWFRFVVAGDTTVIYAEPLAYSPIIYRGYDAHEDRELNTSLVLEAIPYQDHITNLITQQLLTIKQNLISVVFVNEDAIGKGTMDKVHNLGQKLYMETSFIPYSSKMMQFAGKDLKEAFIPVNFPRLDTTAILQGIRTLLDMMERVLVMSSQEIGAAASHEQTAQETRVIQQSTSNRLNFTASYDDDADLAWKKQLYDAVMAYGDDEMYAQIGTTVTEDVKKSLDKLGFTVEEEGDQKKNTKTLVKGGKTALLFEEFASNRAASDRIDNVALSNAMVQLLQVVIANPALYAAIGAVQAVKMINEIAKLAGFYNDFKLEVMPGSSPEEVQSETQEQVGQMLAQVKQALEQEMGAAIQPIAEGLTAVTESVGQMNQVVPQLVEGVQAMTQKVQQMEQGTAQVVQQIGQKDAEQDQIIQQLVQLIQVATQGQPPPPPPPEEFIPPPTPEEIAMAQANPGVVGPTGVGMVPPMVGV